MGAFGRRSAESFGEACINASLLRCYKYIWHNTGNLTVSYFFVFRKYSSKYYPISVRASRLRAVACGGWPEGGVAPAASLSTLHRLAKPTIQGTLRICNAPWNWGSAQIICIRGIRGTNRIRNEYVVRVFVLYAFVEYELFANDSTNPSVTAEQPHLSAL